MSNAALRNLSWVAMIIVLVAALAFGTFDDRGPTSGAERSANLSRTIACPVCTGESVAESNAPIAVVIRTEIKQQVSAGMSDAAIREVYMDRYGEWVNLEPSGRGLTSVVWIAPFLVVGAAIGALALAFSRWRPERTTRAVTDDDLALVESARSADRGSL